MTISVSYSKLRQNLKSYIDKVCDNSDAVLIKRSNGENAVLISEEDYNSLDETAYLLRSKANKDTILDSLKELEEGKGKEFKSLKELSDEYNS